MDILLAIILLIVGFIILIKGADFLVSGASSLALKLSISEIVIGLTIVAFGTSAPELVVNIFSSLKGTSDITYGNIIGSNITNIILILGISGIIYPLTTKKNTVWREIPFSLVAVFVLIVLSNDMFFSKDKTIQNVLSRGDGIILLFFFIIFLTYAFGISKIDASDEPEINPMKMWKIIVFITLGLAGLFFGGKFVVDNAVIIAKKIGISDKLIGLTVVAIGTSLPELVTSAIAAIKKKPDIAIGNVVGSNIFNIFFIMGVSSLISPLRFNIFLNVDLIILSIVSVIFFITMFTGKRRTLDRWEAVIFVIINFGYTGYIIIRN